MSLWVSDVTDSRREVKRGYRKGSQQRVRNQLHALDQLPEVIETVRSSSIA